MPKNKVNGSETSIGYNCSICHNFVDASLDAKGEAQLFYGRVIIKDPLMENLKSCKKCADKLRSLLK